MFRKIKVKKILDQTKCWSNNFCSKQIWLKKIKGQQKLGTKSLVKIGSVIAELFLVWTKVAKANVAWTNVTVTVFIC